MNFLIAFLITLTGALQTAHAQSTQYSVHTGNYVTTANFSACTTVQPCVNFDASMNQSGSFVVSAALTPNINNQNISPLIASFSFFDGLNQYNSNDPSVRIISFRISTDSSGNIINPTIIFMRWLSGNNGAHTPGDRFSYLFLGSRSINNIACNAVAAGPSGVPDSCNEEGTDTSASRAQPIGPFVWNSTMGGNKINAVPTLSTWTTIALFFTTLFIALFRLKRQV